MIRKLIKIKKNSKALCLGMFRYLSAKPYHAEPVELFYESYDSHTELISTQPPLIVLPALLCSTKNWDSLCDALNRRTGRRVICANPRNHAGSQFSSQHSYFHMASDIKNLANKLGLPKVSLLGHSMGGNTGMVVSLLHGDLVSSLIVVDISPGKLHPEASALVSAAINAMHSVNIPAGVNMSEARQLADEQMKDMIHRDSLRKYLIANLVQTKTGAFTWTLNLPALKQNFVENFCDFPSELRGLQYKGPTLFLKGELSDFLGLDDWPLTKEYFPLAELCVVKDSGHWIQTQKPEEFINIVSKFLNKQG